MLDIIVYFLKLKKDVTRFGIMCGGIRLMHRVAISTVYYPADPRIGLNSDRQASHNVTHIITKALLNQLTKGDRQKGMLCFLFVCWCNITDISIPIHRL